MKRLFAVLSIVAALALTSCEVIGSNVAATVDGKDITIDQVQALVNAQAKPTADQKALHQLDGSTARRTLSEWIQLVGAERILHDMGKSPSSTDRQQAEQAAASLKGVSSDTKAELVTDIAAANTLVKQLSTPSNPAFRALAEQAFDALPASSKQLTCSDAVYGPASATAQVQKLIDSGASLSDPAAFADAGFSAASTTKQLCVAKSDLPEQLATPYFAAPKGVVEHADFSTQGQDGSQQDSVLFFEITGQSKLTASSATVTAQVQQAVQQNPNLILAAPFKKLAIHIDPRFGSGFDMNSGVLPPATPITPPTAKKSTSLPVGGSSSGSSGAASSG